MGAEEAFGTAGTLFGHSPRPTQGRFWLKMRSAYIYSLASCAPGLTSASRNQEPPPGPKHATVPAGWGRAAGPGARGRPICFRRPPWWMGGSEHEKGMGSDFLSIFFIMLLNSPPRNPQKRDKKNREKKSVLDFWSSFV
jgi:hypothetical protein